MFEIELNNVGSICLGEKRNYIKMIEYREREREWQWQAKEMAGLAGGNKLNAMYSNTHAHISLSNKQTFVFFLHTINILIVCE